jgi:hypothetical protein
MKIAIRAEQGALVNRDELECTRGEIAFARRSPDEEAPSVIAPGYESYPMVLHDVTIRNARAIAHELSIDREGFELVRHATACADIRDPCVMADRYMQEMVPFIQEHFGASWVVPRKSSTYMRRAAGTGIPKAGWNAVTGVREPAGLAHVDYAPVTAPMVAAAENQLLGIPIKPYSRLMVIQAWRALSEPPQDFPLAFCDASTLTGSDIAVVDYVGDVRRLERKEPGAATKSSNAMFGADQRWYYFPDLRSDELILFKGYDSEEHYKVQSAHSAFDNRRTFPDAMPRESVEARFFVYFN